MNRTVFALLAVWLPTVVLWADDISLADGQVLHATVTRVDPDGIVVETAAGVEKLDFAKLSTEAAKHYGYNPDKAQQFRKDQSSKRAAQVQQQMDAIRAQQAALQKKIDEQPTPEQAEKLLKVQQTVIFASGTVAQGTSKGSQVNLSVQQGEAARTMLGKDTRQTISIGRGFIYGLEAASGESWSGRIYPAGYFHAKDAYGEEMTINAYALTPEDAIVHGADGTAKVISSRDPASGPHLPGGLKGQSALDR